MAGIYCLYWDWNRYHSDEKEHFNYVLSSVRQDDDLHLGLTEYKSRTGGHQNDTRPTITRQISATRDPVSTVFAQYERDRQSLGAAASSTTDIETLDFFLAEYRTQQEINDLAELFAKQYHR